MKKFIAFVCAAVMTVASVATVFAQPSVQVSGVADVQTAKGADGKEVNVEIKEVAEADKAAVEEVKKAEVLKEVLGGSFEEGMQVVDVKEISVPDGTVFPVTITFAVPGVAADSKVAVLHWTGSAWEVVEATAGDGTITATFNSLSPVAFVVGGGEANLTESGNTAGESNAAESAKKSPGTGETNVMLWAGMVAVVALGGMVLTYKKRKSA